MARGKSRSHLSRSERIESACEYFRRGYSTGDVAKKLKVARNTAAAYREIYEERLAKKADTFAGKMNDHPLNAQRMIDELEEARNAAWVEFNRAGQKVEIECEKCEHRMTIRLPDPDVKAKFLALAMRAQNDRSKLFGTMGVKADVLAAVQAVKFVQDKMLQWMSENLCAEDREALTGFLMGPEMAPYMGRQTALPIISGESWELPIGESA